MFPQITANGVEVTGPLAPNTPVNYECMDTTNFFLRGLPTSNMCDNLGMYASATAPTCERGKRCNHKIINEVSVNLQIYANEICH